MFYYNGLRNWPKIKGPLMDTCLCAQDNFKILLDKFRIKYSRERVLPLAGTGGVKQPFGKNWRSAAINPCYENSLANS